MGRKYVELINAGCPLIWARTYEPERFLVQLMQDLPGLTYSEPETKETVYRNLAVWDCVRGYRVFSRSPKGDYKWGAFAEESSNPFGIVNSIINGPENTIWLLNNLQYFLDQPPVVQGLLNGYQIFKAKTLNVFVVAPEIGLSGQGALLSSGLPKTIEREFTVFTFPLPDREQLDVVLRDTEENSGIPCTNREEVLNASKGLTWSEFENALTLALVRSKTYDPKIVMELKSQMVEKNACLEFSRYTETFADIGGLEYLKAWVLNRFQKRNQTKAKLPLRGIMLLGVPGTGKSLFAKALANTLGWPGIILPFSRVFGGLVGESESKMRSSLDTVSAMAPCVLFIDEIDKGLSGVGGSSSDGGTTQRVGGIFLTWMQERSEDIFVIGTANDIRSLPTEYKRAGGRWDAIFFVDLPNPDERHAIMEMYLNKFEIEPEAADKAREVLPKLIEGYTGAEIMQTIIEIGYGATPKEAATFVKPLIRTQEKAIAYLREQAKAWVGASSESGIVIPSTSDWKVSTTPTKRRLALD